MSPLTNLVDPIPALISELEEFWGKKPSSIARSNDVFRLSYNLGQGFLFLDDLDVIREIADKYGCRVSLAIATAVPLAIEDRCDACLIVDITFAKVRP